LALIASLTVSALSVFAERVNLAKFQDTTSDSVDGNNVAAYATDGIVHHDSRWVSVNDANPHWLQVTFPDALQIGSAHVYTGTDDLNPIANFSIQYKSGNSWLNVPGATVTGNTSTELNIVFSSAITASEFRLYTDDDGYARVKEIALYATNGPSGYPLGTDETLNLAWQRDTDASSINGSNYPKEAVDGFVGSNSRWESADNAGDDTLEITLSSSQKIARAHVYTGASGGTPVSDFKLQYYNGTAWQDIPGASVAGNVSTQVALNFTTPVDASQVRFWSAGSGIKRVEEIVLFAPNGGVAHPFGTSVTFTDAPTQKFVTYDDGYWRVRNVAASLTAIAPTNDNVVISDSSTPDNDKQYQILLNVGTDTYRIRNRTTGKVLAVAAGNKTAGAPVIEQSYTGLPYQNWRIEDVGGGNDKIVNEWSGLALQTATTGPVSGSAVVQHAYSGGAHQQWSIAYITHFPKKGMAGYLGNGKKWSAGWGYDWSRNSGTMGNGNPIMPMQHNGGWPAWNTLPQKYPAWNGRGRQTTLLGFNEPDKSDQANMTVSKAIEYWPRLERVNVPLASPVPANYGSWISSFMSQRSSRGYRVDYMAVHWYGTPNGGDAGPFLDYLDSIHNAYGNRPVWLKEFSTVDWGGNANWTEEDNYNFFGEFLWRAENRDKLNKYAMFIFSGNPPANPWTKSAPRGNIYKSGGTTLTALGELYAAWDGDQNIYDDKPYILHNRAARHRLRNQIGSSTPSAGTIRQSDAYVQWKLMPAGGSKKYIVSMLDGTVLSYDGSQIAFVAATNTGPNVEWTIAHNEFGYYFINHPATGTRLRLNRSNDGNGAPVSLTYDMPSTSSTGNSVSWRFVQPWKPVGAPTPVGGEGEVAVWQFNETSGTTAADATGNGYTGNLTNSPTWTTNNGRNYLQFNSTSQQFVEVPGLPDLQGPLTVACWAKSDAATWNASGTLASKRDQFILHPWLGTRKISFIVFDSGGTQRTADFDLAVVPGGFDLTQWHHYAGTYDNSSGLAAIYVDGVRLGYTNITPALLKSDTGVLTIGRDDSQTRYFSGGIDDVQLFARALGASEIADMANAVENDGDGMLDFWEQRWFGNLNRTGTLDFDGDGLTDLQEFEGGTNPTSADTDGDGASDAFEVANGFNAIANGAIFRWTAGGDGVSLYQENNWTQLYGSGAVLSLVSSTPISHDLWITNGTPGGSSGFSAHLDIGAKTASMQGGTLRGQSSANVRGTAAGNLRIGGGSTLVNALDTIRCTATGKPTITFFGANPYLNGATMDFLANSSPKITIKNTIVDDVNNAVLPSMTVEGSPAVEDITVQLVQSGTDVIIYRAGDTDGDKISDAEEWTLGYDPLNPADGLSDPDNDGLPTWMELRLGSNPNSPSSGFTLALTQMTTNGPTLQFGPGGTNLTYRMLSTPGLGLDWNILREFNSGEEPVALYELTDTNAPASGALYRLQVLDGGQ